MVANGLPGRGVLWAPVGCHTFLIRKVLSHTFLIRVSHLPNKDVTVA